MSPETSGTQDRSHIRCELELTQRFGPTIDLEIAALDSHSLCEAFHQPHVDEDAVIAAYREGWAAEGRGDGVGELVR